MSVENGKVCCNCRHCKRISKEHGKRIECRCDRDNAYLTYTNVLSYWCRHWSKESKEVMIHKSQTRLTTKWVKSDLCGEGFLTCKNCKDKGIKIRRAYRKDYCEMWEYCPKCGAKFVRESEAINETNN